MINAASFKPAKGSSGWILRPSRWTNCWGIFEGQFDDYDKKDPRVILSIATNPSSFPYQVAFIESQWFRELIGDDSVKVLGRGLDIAVAAHDNKDYSLKAFNDAGWSAKTAGDNLLTIEASLETPADRFISAMRFITSFTRSDRYIEGIPEHLKWTWPVVHEFIATRHRPYSDGNCTFFPITAGDVRSYCDDKGCDLDDIELEEFAYADDFYQKAETTLGALVEVLTRTEKEFSFLSEQTEPIHRGYTKDDHRMVDTSLPEDEVLSVMAPTMAKPHGEVVNLQNVYKLLAQTLK